MNYKTLYEKTKDLSLLLVEDYAPLRDDMVEVLEDLFATVVPASNGLEALGLYDKQVNENNAAFDLVIADIKMPVMDGIELCEMLKERNELQQIIMLSAHTDSEYLLKLINLGIAQFLNKPIDQDALFETLFHVCSKFKVEAPETRERTELDFGEHTVWYKEKSILIREGYPVTLTRQEILLMELFVAKRNHVCSNDDVLQHFYHQGMELNEKNIRNLVFKLRKKLPKTAIESIYGMGYKLVL